MKTIKITLLLIGMSISAFAQVGIGNTDPKATLDITASNTGTPSNEDGILIPRIANFPTTNPGSDQDGMMVFYTGTALSGKGFYYWDSSSNTWVSIQTAVNSLVEGNDTDINSNQIDIEPVLDNVHTINSPSPDFLVTVPNSNSRVQMSVAGNQFFNVGPRITENIGIGVNNGSDNTDRGLYNTFIGYSAGQNTTSTTGNTSQGSFNQAIGGLALSSNTTGVSNIAIGYNALGDNVTGNSSIAIGTEALSSSTAANNIAIGVSAGYNTTTGSGNIFLGRTAGFNETGSNKLYIENSNANSNNALIYGEFDNDILRTNGEFQIGDPSGTGYALPTTDGTNGQVMTTDGAGNLAFTTINTSINEGNDTDVVGNQVDLEPILDVVHTINSPNDIFELEIPFNSNPNKVLFTISSTNAPFFSVSPDISSNIGIGFNNGSENTNAGLYNIFMGYNSGRNTTSTTGITSEGSNNIAFGQQSLYINTVGNENIAIGSNALRDVDTGDENVAVGSYALSNVLGSRNVAIGNNAGFNETGSDKLYIENSMADADNALIYGEFGTDNTTSGNILRTNSQFQIGNPSVTGYAFPTTDGSNAQVLTSDGMGNVTFEDLPITTNTDEQDLGNNIITPNEEVEITITNGTNTTINIQDADADNTNEIQNLSVNGNDLDISGGGTSASLMAFVNPKFPDGMEGLVGVTHNFTTGNYVVPPGKNLYITNIYSASVGMRIRINPGFEIFYGRSNFSGHQPITNPMIAGAGQTITAIPSTATMNGFLVDAKVTPVSSQTGAYSVPSNQMLVVLSVKRAIGTGAVISRVNGNVVYQGNGNAEPNASLNSFFNPIIVDSGQTFQPGGVFNGYLINK